MMLVDIEKFIYKDKIYSKCNESEKEMIDTFIHGVRQQIETFKETYNQAQEEIALLKRENKALADDNELKCELNQKLNKQIKILSEKISVLANDSILCNEHCPIGFPHKCNYECENPNVWEEWSMND